MIRVVITGANGFVGKNLLESMSPEIFEPIWFTSKDVDLREFSEFKSILDWQRPSYVVHLAGRVGGITDNANNQKEFLETNLAINTNVIRAVDELKIPTISLSSSCCYPLYEQDKYPVSESDFHIGNFEKTNYTYALAKASMMKQIELSNNQHICYIPCNLVGKHDHFGKAGAHFVPAMIAKLLQAKQEGKEKIRLLGTGKSLRQFMYVGDLCDIIRGTLFNNKAAWEERGRFVNVGPQRNLSIKEASEIIRDKFAPELEIEFDGRYEYDGIYRKDISDAKFQSYYANIEDPHRPGVAGGYDFEYTDFEEMVDILKNENLSIT
jgi:GDP-L-fucose synthase